MLAAAWLLLLACGVTGKAWTGDVRQVDAVILDNTRQVWVDGDNIVTTPYRRLIMVDGDRVSARRLTTPPLLLDADGQTIIVYQYWDDSEAVQTRHYCEIETTDHDWLQRWRWQESLAESAR